MEGAVKSGANLVRVKATIQGQHPSVGFFWLDIDGVGTGQDIFVYNGYPAVAGSCSLFMTGLHSWIDINLPTSCTGGKISSDDWYGTVSTQTFDFMPAGFISISESCYMRYAEQTGPGTPASILTTLVTSGC